MAYNIKKVVYMESQKLQNGFILKWTMYLHHVAKNGTLEAVH